MVVLGAARGLAVTHHCPTCLSQYCSEGECLHCGRELVLGALCYACAEAPQIAGHDTCRACADSDATYLPRRPAPDFDDERAEARMREIREGRRFGFYQQHEVAPGAGVYRLELEEV